MAKRKQDDSDIDVSSTDSEAEIEQENDEEEQELVNVDFDFFDLNPEVDFHATKNLLRQLLGDDAVQFDLSSLADLILKDNSVGSCIKTDGKDGDPFALLSVINISNNLENPTVKKLVEYFLEKTNKQADFNVMLRKLLADKKLAKVGLIVSERLINMPVEVVPPMYKMLHEEMVNAEDAHERYEFDYFLVVSKVYEMVAAVEQEEQKSNKKKKAGADTKKEMDYFHYEDLVLEANSLHHGYYPYTHVSQETDSRRVFTEYGLDPQLSLILLTKEQLQKSVPDMEEKFPPF